MSLRNKLIEAAKRATLDERGRILWLLDQMERELQAALKKKLLIESQRHALATKIAIFKALANKLRRGIASGARPTDAVPDKLPEDL